MRHTSKALSAFWQSPLERLELFVNTTRSLMTWSTRLATAALGLGLALAAHAEPVEGEVKKVDQEAAKITLKHGEIKSLDMPAMQMAYRVSNPAWLKQLQVGDKVTFSAEKVGGQFTLTAIELKK